MTPSGVNSEGLLAQRFSAQGNGMSPDPAPQVRARLLGANLEECPHPLTQLPHHPPPSLPSTSLSTVHLLDPKCLCSSVSLW